MIQFDLRIFLKWVGEKPPTRYPFFTSQVMMQFDAHIFQMGARTKTHQPKIVRSLDPHLCRFLNMETPAYVFLSLYLKKTKYTMISCTNYKGVDTQKWTCTWTSLIINLAFSKLRFVPSTCARWTSISYKWSCNLCKWPYKWVTGLYAL